MKSHARQFSCNGTAIPKKMTYTNRCLLSRLENFFPWHSLWILPDNRVVDIATEGFDETQTAFSHGIFVKQWVKFRLDRFHPDREEYRTAESIRIRAHCLMTEDPSLRADFDEEGQPNPFSGDMAYKQAAMEQGWIRIRATPDPTRPTIILQYVQSCASPVLLTAVHDAARNVGCNVDEKSDGALPGVLG